MHFLPMIFPFFNSVRNLLIATPAAQLYRGSTFWIDSSTLPFRTSSVVISLPGYDTIFFDIFPLFYDLITQTVPTCIRSPHAWANPVLASFLTCRLPASPLNCQNISQIFIIPAAAIGFPTPSNPPDGHTGNSPSLCVMPSTAIFAASPLPANCNPSM